MGWWGISDCYTGLLWRRGSGGGFCWAHPTGRRLQGKTKTHWKDHISCLARKHIWIAPEELDRLGRESDVWNIKLSLGKRRMGRWILFYADDTQVYFMLLPSNVKKVSLSCSRCIKLQTKDFLRPNRSYWLNIKIISHYPRVWIITFLGWMASWDITIKDYVHLASVSKLIFFLNNVNNTLEQHIWERQHNKRLLGKCDFIS